jgi:hypothetical protein
MPMTKFTLAPTKNGPGWDVIREGQIVGHHETKVLAMAEARSIARAEKGSLQIKGRNGRIQEERSYGKDPRRSKG